MNILLVCGGSGGHISPAIAVAEHLSDHRCMFIISKKHVDTIFTRKYSQFSFQSVEAKPFSTRPIKFLKFLKSQIKSFFFAKKFLNKQKIDFLLSFGGFTSLGFILAAKLRKIPIILHESNQIPGKSTRFLSALASRVILPEDVFLKFFNKKVVHLGYPIRSEFFEISKEDARTQLGWPLGKTVILVVGGSNGALSLRRWAEHNFSKFSEKPTDIFCIAGPDFKGDETISANGCTLHMLAFCENMNLAIRASDLIISRAGAGSIAECTFCKRPMILVPYPFAANNHQLANALAAKKQGIAVVVQQQELNSLLEITSDLLSNDAALSEMKRRLDRIHKTDNAEKVANFILSSQEILRKNKD